MLPGNMKRLAVAIMLLSASLSAGARPMPYLSENFKTSNGLSDNFVKSLLCDSRGIIWIGTAVGLDYYDGYRIHHCPISEYVSSKYVTSIIEDKAGKIWFSTTRELVCIDLKTGSVRNIEMDLGPLPNLTRLALSPTGEIWVPFDKKGLLKIDTGTLKVSHSDCPLKAVDFDEDGTTYGVLDDNTIITSKDYCESYTPLFEDFNPFDGKKIVSIIHAGDFLFTGIQDFVTIIRTKDRRLYNKPWIYIADASAAEDGTVWVATNNGIYHADSLMNEVGHYSYDEGTIPDNATKSICLDKTGGIWIGTYFEGLCHLCPNTAEIELAQPFNNHKTRVLPIVRDNQGKIWLGTETEGLLRYDPKSDSYEHIPLPLSSKNIISLLLDGTDLIISCFSQSSPILKLDINTLKSSEFYRPFNRKIDFIQKTSSGDYFLAGLSPPQMFGNPEKGFQKILDHPVSKIIECAKDDYWAVRTSSPIRRYRNGAWKEYLVPGEKNPIGANDLALDRDGKLWIIGSYGLLMFYDPETDSIIPHSNISDSRVFSLSEDADGYFWITTDKGIITFDKNTGKKRLFTKRDGLDFSNFNTGYPVIGDDGRLYAGTSDGWMSFNTAKMHEPRDISDVLFTGYSIEESVASGSTSDNLILLSESIHLRHRNSSFSVRMSAFDYSMPRSYVLEYRLYGMNNEWRTVQDGEVSFSKLKPGKYSLQIRKVLNDGSVADGISSMPIQIDVPLLLSAPFIILYLALLAISAALIYSFASRKAAAKAALEAKIKGERMEAARQKEMYLSKVAFISNMAGKIKTPLSLIKLPTESLLEKFNSYPDKSVTNELNTISRNSDALSDFMDELLDFQKIEKETFNFEKYLKKEYDAPSASQFQEHSSTILIVEDNADMRDIFRNRFNQLFDIVEVASAAEAKATVKSGKIPSIVISEIILGENDDGFSLCRELKKNEYTTLVPVILIGPSDDPDYRLRSLRAGADSFLPKPFSADVLTAMVSGLLEGRRSIRKYFSENPAIDPVKLRSESPDNVFMVDLNKYIRDKLNVESLRVDEIAGEFAMSPSKLQKKIKELTGLSVAEYIIQVKIKKACELLSDKSLSIAEISSAVGFSSPAYFSDCFRRKKGMTPNQYRKQGKI